MTSRAGRPCYAVRTAVRHSNGRSNHAPILASAAARPPSRSTRRRDARRDAILRAAARMFRERGFADTGMRDIAVAADLSPANLYHYFGGKDEILYYCQDRALDRMLAAVRSAARAEPTAPRRLHRVLAAHVLTLLDEVEGASAHLETAALSPARRARLVRKRDRYERALRRLIEDGVRRGECVAPDAALAARAMLGALNWTVTWFDPAGPAAAAEVAERIAAYLVRGVAARPGSGGRALRLVPRPASSSPRRSS
ncbi:MAG: TetR/AcrR family transcriptional regulator [Vicinamibacterales bacterium]